MPAYTSITIIFNPASTGNGKQLAQELKAALLKKDAKLHIKLAPTDHAGHAETLAYKFAMTTKKSLIISASGDGGYHEVINGIVKARRKGSQAVAGLLPAGNANDHYASRHSHNIVDAILKQHEQTVDLLKITARSGGKPFERFAHSYAGIGLTPQVGHELNKVKLNWFNQIVIVLRVLLFLRPVRISVAGKARSYDSLVFSNIEKMSKVLTLSKNSSPRDGKFEITAFRRRNRLKLIGILIRSSTIGLAGTEKSDKYSFKTLRSTKLQLDGEITIIDSNSEVKVTIEQQALTCVI